MSYTQVQTTTSNPPLKDSPVSMTTVMDTLKNKEMTARNQTIFTVLISLVVSAIVYLCYISSFVDMFGSFYFIFIPLVVALI